MLKWTSPDFWCQKMHRNGNLIPPAQATSCFKYVNLQWKRGGHLCSFSWKHETRKLYCGNSLLRLEILLFPKSLSLAFILNSVAASFPKCLYRNRKVDKNAEFSNTIGPFPIFLQRWMGYLYVWCVHSRFQWWKNITFDTNMRLIMPKDTVACKGNRGERR